MVSEAQKYRAQFFQIVGISFMTLFGKIILGLFDPKFEYSIIRFLGLLFVSTILVLGGIIFILKGIDNLEGERKT